MRFKPFAWVFDGARRSQACRAGGNPAASGGWEMRLALCNPLSLVSCYRMHEVSQQLAGVDVVVLPGTRIRAHDDRGVIKQSLDRHTALHAGWCRGQHTNRSAGVTILVGRRFRERSIVEVTTPPKQLSGRGLAIRIRSGCLDVKIIGVYVPPYAGGAKKLQAHRACVEMLAAWVEKELSRTPCRCAPFLMMDMNDRFGWERIGSEEYVGTDDAVGEVSPGREGVAAKIFRDILGRYDMCAYNTFHPVGDTYYGPKGSSRIDFVCGPCGLFPHINSINLMRRAGRRMQLIPSPYARDHVPIHVDMQIVVCSNGEVAKADRWDYDSLALALRSGVGRPKFLEEMEAELRDMEGWAESVDSQHPDEAWDRFVGTIKRVAHKHFGPGGGKYGEVYEQHKAARITALRERGRLREEMADVPLAGLSEVAADLARHSRMCRSMRDKHQRDMLAIRVEELWEAWRKREFAIVWKAARALAQNSSGPKKRFYNVATLSSPSIEEWEEYLSRPAVEGGMQAERYNGEEVVAEMKSTRAAWADLRDMRAAIKNASCRRAAPPWSAPAEVWRILFHPTVFRRPGGKASEQCSRR